MRRVKLTDKKNGDVSFEMVKSDKIFAVRLKPGFRNLSDAQCENFFCHYGAKILFEFRDSGAFIITAQEQSDSVDIKEKLIDEPGIEYVGGAYLIDGHPVIYTGNIVIVFRESESEEQCLCFLSEHGLIIKNKIPELGNVWLVEPKEVTGTEIFNLSDKLATFKEVEICYPEIIQNTSEKIIHYNQWHLMPTRVSYSAYIDASANVASAHEITKGAGITIAIIDTGIDTSHPEFSGKDKIIAPANFEPKSVDNNPAPRNPDEAHGTACAGVALASGHYGASGVAPDAKLMPIRNTAPLGSFNEAQAFMWAARSGADIISCSWGPDDGDPLDPNDPYHFRKTPLAPLTKRAIDYAVKHGRKGKGCIIFFASGNGNESVDNDGYASYKNVIAVAACNDESRRSYYSDYGKAIFCCFPSSDNLTSRTPGIWTTDVTGGWGYNPNSLDFGDQYGNFTNDFGGTSSACPGAAGVAALILSVNNDLTFREVKEVLKKCCDKIDERNGKYKKNGHSEFYGYGRLNAAKAIKIASEIKVAQKNESCNCNTQPVSDVECAQK